MFFTARKAVPTAKEAQGSAQKQASEGAPASAELIAVSEGTADSTALPRKRAVTLSSSAAASAAAARPATASTAPTRDEAGLLDLFAPPQKGGQLRIALLRGRGLAIGDKSGTSDPYAKVRVRTGSKELKKESKVIRKTLDPVWEQCFSFDGVADSTACEVVIIVYDEDGFFEQDDVLGQVVFRLSECKELSHDGAWVALDPRKLEVASESAKRTKIAPSGELDLLVAWLPPTDEEVLKIRGAFRSKELEVSDGDSSEEDDRAADGGDGQADAPLTVRERMDQQLQPGDYQLIVHVHEARDLASRDDSGASDPCVFVECFGQRRNTATIEQALSPLWDEQLFLEGHALTSDELNAAVVMVRSAHRQILAVHPSCV